VFAVAIAPLLEEFLFRGVLQRTLERRWRDWRAIVVATFVFALVHWHPGFMPALPLYLFLGLAFGYAAYATRTIWAGVILHAANNAMAMVSMAANPGTSDSPPIVWSSGPTREWWLSVLAALVTGAMLYFVARGLWNARNDHGLRHAAADG
jgi:membrane protease YdiL (CAAX protease family)